MRKNYILSLTLLIFVATHAYAQDAALYSRLFTPLTFYHDATHQLLSLDADTLGENSMLSKALMRIYLNRPDLVRETEGRLTKSNTPVPVPQAPVTQQIDFVEEAPKNTEVENIKFDAPVEIVVSKPNFWTFKPEVSFQFYQNYVSDNWYNGGESNYSAIGSTTLQLNYDNKEKVKWDNKLEMKLGFQTSPGDTVHNVKTTEDLLRLTSKLGLQAHRKWYYTLQLIAYTQFTKGYKSNDKKVYSDFMSPFNLNLSLGMDYKVSWLKNKLTGTINISPFACNYRYVSRLDLATRYSIDEGHHSLFDYGSTLTADLKMQFSDKLSLKSRLYGYTTYSKADVQWENTLTLQLSKYITTNLFFYPRFDDSRKRDGTHGYFQFKEYWSLGFSYSY